MLDSLIERLRAIIAAELAALAQIPTKRDLELSEHRILTRITKLEKRIMTAQADFQAAMQALSTRLGTLQGDFQAQIDAAVAAQKAKDDAASAEDRAAADKAFTDAVTQLSALTASLPEHVEAVQQAASAPQPAAGGDAAAPASTGTTDAPAASGEAPAADPSTTATTQP